MPETPHHSSQGNKNNLGHEGAVFDADRTRSLIYGSSARGTKT